MLATWLGIIIGIVALCIAYVTYKSQQTRKQLEYIITSSTSVVPAEVSNKLKVTYGRTSVSDAAVTIIRLVNSGNTPINPEDFNSDISIELLGANSIVSALFTKTRPVDLSPKLKVTSKRMLLSPLLINREDMMEFQLLTSGLAKDVQISGRLSGVKFIRRKDLPYPPGSGEEGELLEGDKIIWYFVAPAAICIVVILYLTSHPLPKILVLLGVVAMLVYCLYIHPMYVSYLVRRRRIWRP